MRAARPRTNGKSDMCAGAKRENMPRLRWILASLLLVPLLDALFLVFVAGAVGWRLTVALVVLTGLLGMLLVRAEGRHTVRSLQRKVSMGDIPTNELLDGGLLIAAGALLLTPGLVTDLIGFLFALPVTRYPVRTALRRFVVTPYLDRKADGFVTGDAWTTGFPEDDAYEVDSDSYRVEDN